MAPVSDEPATDTATDTATDEPADASPDAIFEALWARVEEAWDDDKPHGAILEHALNTEKLPELAGRYRKLKEKDETRAARAQKKIDGIVVAATQMLMAMKTPPRTKVPWTWTASVAIACAFIIAWLSYKLFFSHP
jgi:hypothetical protein